LILGKPSGSGGFPTAKGRCPAEAVRSRFLSLLVLVYNRSEEKGKMKRMGSSILVLIVAGNLLLGGCRSRKPEVYRVGMLDNGGAFFDDVSAGFKARMTELGYLEGQNITYDIQDGKNDPVEMRRVIRKFVAKKIDLVFTVATPPSVIAKAVTQGTDVPVVFTYAGIEGADLVESVREPGGNITGVRFPGPEQISKRLEILLEIAPGIERVWIGYEKGNPNTAPALEALRGAAKSSGVTLVEVPAATLEEIEADLAARSEADDIGFDAMLLMPDGFNHSPNGLPIISGFAKQHSLPLGGSFLYTVEAGALFGNANNLTQVGELAAPLADKMFKGVPAGTIPVVTPEQELWINYAVAQELGLSVPEGLLKMADGIVR
jgi:putative ABC transport system substrate-binding protein